MAKKPVVLPLSIQRPLGRYYRALQTEDCVYYVNYSESDENAQVLMYGKKHFFLWSDNYHAFAAMDEVLSTKTYTKISRRLKQAYEKSIGE